MPGRISILVRGVPSLTDKCYSRIDFAKQKFGGSFTTEEVEDVKTFWRVVMVLVVCSIFGGFFNNTQLTLQNLIHLLRDTNFNHQYSSSESHCFQRDALYNVGYILIVIWIPLTELLPFPHSLTTKLTKFNIGFLLALVTIIGYFLLDVIGHVKLGESAMNVTCLLEINVTDHNTPSNLLPLDYKLAKIAYNFKSISEAFMLTAAMQLISAQSPYSMKG